MSGNGKSYTDAVLEFSDRLDVVEQRIIDKLDKNFEWQRGVDSRLATGAEKFKHLEKDIDHLKLWDKGLGVVSIIGSTIASIIGIEK